MNPHNIRLRNSARRELERLDPPILHRVARAIDALSADPRPTACTKLTGYPNLWRIRVGDYRILYTIDDAERGVEIVAVRHRSDAYR